MNCKIFFFEFFIFLKKYLKFLKISYQISTVQDLQNFNCSQINLNFLILSNIFFTKFLNFLSFFNWFMIIKIVNFFPQFLKQVEN